MKFNFNITRIRFRAAFGQRKESRIAVTCITRQNQALNGGLTELKKPNGAPDNGAPGVPARPRKIRRNKRAAATSCVQLNHPEKSTCPLQLRKQSLFIMKFPRVYAAATPSHFHRMLQMQHLVKQNVLDRITRHPRMIKNTADDNRIVRRIVMPQTAARLFSAPGELRVPHQSACDIASRAVCGRSHAAQIPERLPANRRAAHRSLPAAIESYC